MLSRLKTVDDNNNNNRDTCFYPTAFLIFLMLSSLFVHESLTITGHCWQCSCVVIYELFF
jgi:hypothetical protein